MHLRLLPHDRLAMGGDSDFRMGRTDWEWMGIWEPLKGRSSIKGP